MGWDDNGLPTERRVQNYYGVRCEPHLPYDPTFAPPDKPGKQRDPDLAAELPRAVRRSSSEDEKAFEELWRRLGLSVDWSLTYTTIGERVAAHEPARVPAQPRARRGVPSRRADAVGRRLPHRGRAGRARRPRAAGRVPRAPFHRADGCGDVSIDTTRPELLAACVALVAHPDDERYQPLFGTEVITPLYGARVPDRRAPACRPRKGNRHRDDLHVRRHHRRHRGGASCNSRRARSSASTAASSPDAARLRSATRAGTRTPRSPGKTVKQAQKIVVEQLRRSGELEGEPRPITHPVKFYERGERPLEIVTSRQWYYPQRRPRRRAARRAAELGRELDWHPAHMRARYETGSKASTPTGSSAASATSACRSRSGTGSTRTASSIHDEPIVADRRPICPSTRRPTCPPGSPRRSATSPADSPPTPTSWTRGRRRRSRRRSRPAGSTIPTCSSARSRWICGRRAREIIRTWLFDTVVRAHLEHGALPWATPTINGWVLDPDRKKMSKSKGNVVTPMALVEEYGADAVRYWACDGRPGSTPRSTTAQMKIGRELAIKILNASKFVLGVVGDADDDSDRGHRSARPRRCSPRSPTSSTTRPTAFDAFDYARALERTERFFWSSATTTSSS